VTQLEETDRGRANPAARLALVVGSTLLTLLVLEIGVRIAQGALLDHRHRILQSTVRWSEPFTQHDIDVGWIPRPGTEAWGKTLRWTRPAAPGHPGTNADAWVTIGADGIRSNGGSPSLPERPVILAVGDSFTFGGQVSDHQTWPAALERKLGIRVLNGGVYAYGLDQTVLRAEKLAEAYAPNLIIVSFIRADIGRTEMSVRAGTAAKPFFEIENGRLVAHNSPVPPPMGGMDLFRSVLGYSTLVDVVMRRVAPAYWLAGPDTQVHDRGLGVSCLLMGRLADFGHAHEVSILVVAQQHGPRQSEPERVRRVLDCAEQAGVQTLSLFDALNELASARPTLYRRFFIGHMSGAGNEFVAQRIALEIAGRSLIGSDAARP
jgi:hypothetical protein